MTIEEQVMQLSGEQTGLRDAMIDAYMPFVIARVADTINRYVHNISVKVKMTESAEDYRWSSMKTYLTGKKVRPNVSY